MEVIKYPAANFDTKLMLLENENSRVCIIIKRFFFFNSECNRKKYVTIFEIYYQKCVWSIALGI